MKKAVLFLTLALMMVLGSYAAPTSAQADDCFAEPEILSTADGVEFVRTPDACFENLPDWPYDAQYVEIDGLRQGYVDEGPADAEEVILLLHGQPSWSYLYRDMIPVLVDGGHRVIAMDHIGFGRSDKPIDTDYYTYANHVERLEAFILALELDQANLTIFVQDWGSLIGLNVVGTHPDWFDRLVVGNGFLPTYTGEGDPVPVPDDIEASIESYSRIFTFMPEQQPQFFDLEGNPTDAISNFIGGSNPEASGEGNFTLTTNFGDWINYAFHYEDFRPGDVVEALTYEDLPDAEEQAYNAPYPSRIYMGGPRTFPSLVNELPGQTDAGWEGLGTFDKPFLTIWGNNDPGNLGSVQVQNTLIEHIPGSEGFDHVRLPEASHFLQSDEGEEIATRMNDFIAQTPIDSDEMAAE